MFKNWEPGKEVRIFGIVTSLLGVGSGFFFIYTLYNLVVIQYRPFLERDSLLYLCQFALSMVVLLIGARLAYLGWKISNAPEPEIDVMDLRFTR